MKLRAVISINNISGKTIYRVIQLNATDKFTKISITNQNKCVACNESQFIFWSVLHSTIKWFYRLAGHNYSMIKMKEEPSGPSSACNEPPCVRTEKEREWKTAVKKKEFYFRDEVTWSARSFIDGSINVTFNKSLTSLKDISYMKVLRPSTFQHQSIIYHSRQQQLTQYDHKSRSWPSPKRISSVIFNFQ